MAKLTKKQKKKILSIIVALVLIVASYLMTELEETEQEPSAPAQALEDTMAVHYLDAGQGDSIFIELPGQRTMLIDASTNSAEQTVIDYISGLGYDSIDYVIATHSHEDHIGGMDGVLNTFKVDKFYMPDDVSTTKTYENMLDALENNGAQVNEAKAGVSIISEDSLSIDILSPISSHAEDYGDDHNAWSVMCRIVYGENSFMFTGDAEAETESFLSGDLQSDVLKVGHHGSRTSTSEDFFYKVDPKIAIISCGEDNDYGHPHSEVVSLLESANVKIYRTDISGNITVTSDGKTLNVTTEK